MVKADFITSLVLLAVGIGALVESWRMPRFEHLSPNPYTAPGLVPGIISIVIIVLAATLLIRSVLRAGIGPRSESGVARGFLAGEQARRLYIALGLTLGYAAGLVGRAPFWLATAAFVFGFIVAFEYRSDRNRSATFRLLAIAACEAIVVAVVVSFVFQHVFLIRLP